jgi:DNA polymerase II small subunit
MLPIGNRERDGTHIQRKLSKHKPVEIPDFFITGHIHKSIAANYKNITLISGSCWQSKTAFQEKVGHNPEPGRVPIVNLKTRDIKILKFL